MDGMEVDNVPKCSKFKNKKINLIFYKNCSKKWALSPKGGKNTLTTVPKPKPSLKISLPIIHYFRAMQKYKNTNAGLKAPSPDKTEARRLPQQLGIPPTNPLRLGPSTLRTFRHPVPTSKERTMFADKVAQIVKTPETLINHATSKCDPSMLGSNINVPPIIEPAEKKTEELNTSQSKPNTTMSYNTIPVSIKHKLPLTVVAPKGSYGNRSSNPVNKENRLSSSNNTQATVVQATQTEKVFIVTEQGYQILETIKNSGLTSEDLQNLIDKFNKKKEFNNDEDCVVINLERAEENNEIKNENLDLVMKHSVNNKNILNTCVNMMQMVSSQNHQLLSPPERTTSTSDQQPQSLLPEAAPPATSKYPPLSGSPVPYADMVHTFMCLATLQKLGLRLKNNALESYTLPQLLRTNSQTTETGMQTEDENNSKKRKRHASVEESSSDPLVNHVERTNFQRPFVVTARPAQGVPQQHEIPVFQPQVQPHQPPHSQFQQFGHVHVERPAQLFPTNLPRLMPQQYNQFTVARSHPQYPCEHGHNGSSALSTTQLQAQPPLPAQLHRNDPRRQSMPSQLGGLPRLSRVLSTQEANMHGQATQHSDCNWSYPQYFDRHGNVFPQRHP